MFGLRRALLESVANAILGTIPSIILGIFVIALYLHSKGESLGRIYRYRKLKKNSCSDVGYADLKVIFSLTSKEILAGYSISNTSELGSKSISVIKDIPTRFAGENNGQLSFGIDKRNGNAYKMLKVNLSEENYCYPIDYKELNKYLQMSEKAFEKYGFMKMEEWQNYIK